MSGLTPEELAMGRQLLTRAHELSLDRRYSASADGAIVGWHEWLHTYGAVLLSTAEAAS